jgi:hypothetical protein
MDIWEILWPFVTFCVDLVHFSGSGITYQEKSGNPAYVAGSFDVDALFENCGPVHRYIYTIYLYTFKCV